MASETKEFFEKFKKDSVKMQKQLPNAVNGFTSMFAKIMKDGAISLREKELIALGISIAIQCEPCIRLHTQKSLAAGATREQIFEAASVAMMMSGGPAYTHVPVMLDTLEELEV